MSETNTQTPVKKEEGFFAGLLDMANVLVSGIVGAVVAVFAYQWLSEAEFASDWHFMVIAGLTAVLTLASIWGTNVLFKKLKASSAATE